MSDGPNRLAGQLLNTCIAIFVSALALYGAIYILCAIWVPLCIVVLTVAIVGGSAALMYRHFRRW